MFHGQPYCETCGFVGPDLLWMWHHGIGLDALLQDWDLLALRVVEVPDDVVYDRADGQTQEERSRASETYAAGCSRGVERVSRRSPNQWFGCADGGDWMSVEVFVYRGDDARRRTLTELQADLAAAGVSCRTEELEDGPWLVLEGHETNMSITVDPDGTASSAMVQCMDSPAVLDPLFVAFESLGWVIATEEE